MNMGGSLPACGSAQRAGSCRSGGSFGGGGEGGGGKGGGGDVRHANDERCALKPMHPSLHYCLRIHEHVPPMPSCAQVPLPSATHPRYRRYLPPALPPLPPALTAATASTTAATGVVVAATAAAALPVATAAFATTAALAPLAAAANRHGCSATSDLTHRRCLCYRRRSTVAIAYAGMSYVV